MVDTQAPRPKVFHLITRLLNGGAEEKLWAEVKGLQQQYDFSVGHGASFVDEQVARYGDIGVPVTRFVSIRHYNPLALLIACVGIYRHLRSHPVDIVHTHSTEAGIVGRIAARWARVPVIVHTIHGVPFTEHRAKPLSAFIKHMERKVTRWTDCVIANADAITRLYLAQHIGRPEQYVTIPSGVDLEKFQTAQPLELDVPTHAVKVLMAARLTAGKGFDELIAAAEILRTSHPDLVFLIAGAGPLEASLAKKIAQKGLTANVKLLGHQRWMDRLMQAVDMLVLPSYREGTPRVISEAMAAGLPVVATNIDGIPDQIEHGANGLLIEPRSAPQLAEAIASLADDPTLRKRMGQAGQDRSKTFSQEAMVEATDRLYRRLLNRERCGVTVGA